jgi:hypothetical protein
MGKLGIFPFSPGMAAMGFSRKRSHGQGWPHLGLPDVWDFDFIEMSPEEAQIPLVMTNSLLLKMAIERVDLPMKNGDFP